MRLAKTKHQNEEEWESCDPISIFFFFYVASTSFCNTCNGQVTTDLGNERNKKKNANYIKA